MLKFVFSFLVGSLATITGAKLQDEISPPPDTPKSHHLLETNLYPSPQQGIIQQDNDPKVTDLISHISLQAKQIESLVKRLELAETRIKVINKKQDGLIWSCLIVGGGILTIFLIYKYFLKRKKTTSNITANDELNNLNPNPQPKTKLKFYISELQFFPIMIEGITNCLENTDHPTVEFERVFDSQNLTLQY